MNIDERIREHIAHAYENAPAIRRIMDNAGVSPDDIQSAADLSKIPITTKDQLVQMHEENPPFGGFLAVDPGTLPRIYISPGPIYDPQPPGEETGAAVLEALESVGFSPGDRVINTFMYHLTPAGLGLDEALQAIGCTVIPTGPGNTDLQIKIALDLEVSGFVGAPSYLGIILDRMDEMGIPRAHIPITKALFTTEPYTLSQRARFEGEYRMRIVSAYGTADLGLFGYTREGVEGFCLVNTVYAETVDPDSGEPTAPGEIGKLVITTFNKGYPLIRFGTGDLAKVAADPHPDCSGQQLLGLYGRSGIAVKVRGMFLHPNQLQQAIAQIPEISQAQAIVTRPESSDVVTLLVELNPGYQKVDITEQVKTAIRETARLRIDEVIFVDTGVIEAEARMVRDDRTWE